MQDDFSEKQWLLYIDGEPSPGMREHVEACADCRAFLASMVDVGQMLQQEAALVRADTPSDDELERMLANCLARLRTDSKIIQPQWTPNEAVLLLRALVEPICGQGTAGASILLALRRSTSSDQRVTQSNWNLFVSNLSDVMVSVCGSAAGRLVNRAGFCLALRER